MSMDSDVEALGHLTTSLKHLQKFKANLHSLFEAVGNGPVDGQDNQSYLLGIQQMLISMDAAFTDLEASGNSLPSYYPQAVNSMSIALEPENENYDTFQQFTNTFAWTKKMQDYATFVSTALKENQLKRCSPLTGFFAKRNKKSYPDIHNVQPQAVDQVLQRVSQSYAQKYPETSIVPTRPFGISCVVTISIGKLLKAVVVLRGLIAENVIVKGYDEITPETDTDVDIWTESKYKVFRLITQAAQSAILHYHSPINPDIALHSFVQWIHSYLNLFSGECQHCGKILNNNMPPTGRSYDKSMTRFHPQCASAQAR